MNRLTELIAQAFQVGDGPRADVVVLEESRTELQQDHPRAVLRRGMVDFNEPLGLERRQQAEARARIEAVLLAEFGRRKFAIVGQERAQEAQGPPDWAPLAL